MTAPTLFRKKPVVVAAVQWDGSMSSQSEIVTWSNGQVTGWFDNAYFLSVETREGEMRADVGDWIIKGTRGEFYPCKPDAFSDTFETIDEAGAPTHAEQMEAFGEFG